MNRIARAAFIVGAVIAVAVAGQATVSGKETHQVVVCKYVGTPGVDERLQTGQNPIVVDSHSLEGKGFDGSFPFAFEDAQGNSVVIRWAANSHDGSITECPGYVAPTPEPTVTPTEEPTVEPTVAPTEEPPVVTPEPTFGQGGPGGPKPTPPNTAVEEVTATPASSVNWGFLLLASILATTILMTLQPRRTR